MMVTINNMANVPKKYIRYMQWRLRNLKSRFKELKSAEVFIKDIGSSNVLYNVHVNIKSEDNELFISKAGKDLDKMIKMIPKMFLSKLEKMNLKIDLKSSN